MRTTWRSRSRTLEVAEPETEPMPVRLGEIVDLVTVQIAAAGGDLVEKRLPEVGAAAVDEGDESPAPPAERVAEPRRELETASTTANDDDPVWPAIVPRIGRKTGPG